MQLYPMLLLAHLLYDFHWQGEFIAKWKYKYRFILFVHALTWSLLICSVLSAFGHFQVWKAPFALATHYWIDAWKCSYPNDEKYFWTIYVDQTLHLISLIIMA